MSSNESPDGIVRPQGLSAGFPIWIGSVPSGLIDLQPALSSTNVPTGALIHADWSQLLVAAAVVGFSHHTARRIADFPAPVQLSARAIGWRRYELLAWLDARPRGYLPTDSTPHKISSAHKPK
jgi:hypothetical protein